MVKRKKKVSKKRLYIIMKRSPVDSQWDEWAWINNPEKAIERLNSYYEDHPEYRFTIKVKQV